MQLHVDLHSHSGYAGGVGNTSLEDVEKNMPLKGIEIVGTGDCLHFGWKNTLQNSLVESANGLFSLSPESTISYLLQTEIIITSDIGSRRKGVHTLLYFPSFEAIDKAVQILEKMGMKNTVGRPFLKCENAEDVSDKLFKLRSIDDLIEIVPAHVMTPEGVFGSKAPVNSLTDFYGDYTNEIHAIETGLSADPLILSLIPELDGMTLLSNSDAHSPALHRMGREFTTLEAKRSYDSIIDAIRKNNVKGTAEFNPLEGRYFLTGHRAGRTGHENRFCVFSPRHTPSDKICPICNKKLTVGVLERALELSVIQGESREKDDMTSKVPFVHMVPLTEIIAYSISIASPLSKKVLMRYAKITSVIPESRLWFESVNKIRTVLDGVVEDSIIDAIINVKNGIFCFDPAGYDGEYGKLKIGSINDVDNVSIISD